jgi:chitin synthase
VTEYEAETWDTGSRHSDETHHTGYSKPRSGFDSKPRSRAPPSRPESPRSYHQASHSGDYYRDTNVTYNNSSNPNLRLGGSQQSHSNLSHQAPSIHQHQQQPIMSQYGGMPQLPFMPFGGGPGSVAGSDYGHGQMQMGGMPMYPQTTGVYGVMPPAGPRNTVMTNLNMFSGGNGGVGGGSQSGGFDAPPTLPQPRPMSTFSLATTVGPMASGPSLNPNPSDDDLFNALRLYLSTQDLMTVTKK